MNKAIFLDRDGVIVKDKNYTFKIKDLEFVQNSIKGLKKLNQENYKLIIITNQSGIGRGFYAEKDYFKFRFELYKRLRNKGITISAEYFCPHHPEKALRKYKRDCNCRKPKSGMLEKAAKDFNLNLEKCWFIGDRMTDIKCGKKVDCKTIHVLTGYEKKGLLEADYVAKNLVESANIIIKNGK